MTERARRAQIVSAAIETIAEEGYTRTSFTRIARRAGLSSTGLISYHFAGKADLMSEVVHDILRRFTEHVLAQEDDGTPAGELSTFIRANMDFMSTNRPDMLALVRIQAGRPMQRQSSDEEPTIASISQDRSQLAELLRRGQGTGQFRQFDSHAVAGFILALRNNVIEHSADPDADMDAIGAELAETVRAMTTAREKR